MKTSPFILIDVDTQFDFMDPRGNLYVPGAEQCLPHIQRLIHTAQKHGIPILSSADAHPQDDPEFADFPPHCVLNTPGQHKLPETLTDRVVVVPQRGLTPPEKQAIQAADQVVLNKNVFDLFSNPNALSLLRESQAHTAIVCGVATEYCVKAAVLGLLKLRMNVQLVTDAIRGVDAQAAHMTQIALQQAGAQCVSTQDVVTHWNFKLQGAHL